MGGCSLSQLGNLFCATTYKYFNSRIVTKLYILGSGSHSTDPRNLIKWG
uniref:Uncharacterized protein n=1 Tax=Planktothrix agardhii TaxID=1160 RepID=A0A1J1JFS5_PLAAG|nr:protein of unknown function [Planktothrix agardhii]